VSARVRSVHKIRIETQREISMKLELPKKRHYAANVVSIVEELAATMSDRAPVPLFFLSIGYIVMHSSRRNNQGNSISNTCHCHATLAKSIVTIRHY